MIKKLLMSACAFLSLLTLTGCNKKEESEPVYITAEVITNNETGLLVEDTDTSKQYIIPTNIIENAKLNDLAVILMEGDIIDVQYSGILDESDPAQITQLVSMEFISTKPSEEVETDIPTQTFTATIASIEDGFITVTADDGQNYSGDIMIGEENLSDSSLSLDELSVGLAVNVEFGGVMTMSLPPQIAGEVTLTAIK